MGHSSAVGFLVFALCLVACVSASTDASAPAAPTAEQMKTLKAANQSVRQILGKAEGCIHSADAVLKRVERFEEKANELNSQAAQALSQATEALYHVELKEKENEAKAIVGKIKNSADTVRTLHENVMGELGKTVASLKKMMSDAQTLKSESEKVVTVIEKSTRTYTDPTAKVADLKTKEVELEKIVNATVKLIDGVDSTAINMKQSLKEAQLENLHVNVIADVEKIKTMIGKADGSIQETEEKKDKVSGIVKEMLNLKTTAPTESNEIIEPLYKSANDALINATRAVQHATNAKAMLTQLNGHADAALKNITAATTAKGDVQKEVTFAKAFVRAVERTALQLQTALQTADDSVTSANDSKKKMETALSSATREERLEQSGINTQVKTLQNSVNASVTQIRTMMDNAGITLQSTTKHKEDVNAIVEEMKKLCKTDITEANDIIQALYKGANDELANATGAVQNATKAIAAVTEQKRIADAALTRVAAAKEVTKAQQEDNTAAGCVAKVTEIVSQLQSALQTAANSLTNATLLKQKFVAALTATTSEPITEEAKETAKSDISVGEDKEPDQKDATIQPTITDTEQPASKELLSQSNNNAKKLKDILMKGGQNGTTLPLTGGKVPELGAKNDSAMTVSVPLLVALIAFAVWQ